MREITIGETPVRVRATPLALLFYRQAFGSDMVSDMMKMQNIENDPSQFDSVILLQMTWAMARADTGPGNQFPPFEVWLNGVEKLDFSDTVWMTAVMEEAADGFFSGAAPTKKQKPKRSRARTV